MELEALISVLRGLVANVIAGMAARPFSTAVSGVLAGLAALAIVGRTNSPSLLTQLTQPVRILLWAVPAFPLVFIALNWGISQWEARDYAAIGAIIGLGVILFLLLRGTTTPPGGK